MHVLDSFLLLIKNPRQLNPRKCLIRRRPRLASRLPQKQMFLTHEYLFSFWKSFLRRSTSPDFLQRRFWGSRENRGPTLLFWKRKHDDDGRPVNQSFWLIKHSIGEKTVRSALDKPVYPFLCEQLITLAFFAAIPAVPILLPRHLSDGRRGAVPLLKSSPAGASLVR